MIFKVCACYERLLIINFKKIIKVAQQGLVFYKYYKAVKIAPLFKHFDRHYSLSTLAIVMVDEHKSLLHASYIGDSG